jgi:transcriptional regulator with PAS, ATPase and Fis domain
MANYEIEGLSQQIEIVKNQIDGVAPTELTVLIQGPTGTGKELIARNIHKKSNRNSKRFIALNCAAIPSELFESEFFGHKKGAFTGATSDQNGKVELAEGGTLFLDEISSLIPQHQDKILRFLQEKSFYVVGDKHPRTCDTRIVAASNQDLLENDRFRDDLYHRLNQFFIQTTELVTRPEDIIYFVNKFIPRKRGSISIEDAKIKFLLYAYHYRGNVRELLNYLEIFKSLKNQAFDQIKKATWRGMCKLYGEPMTSPPTNSFGRVSFEKSQRLSNYKTIERYLRKNYKKGLGHERRNALKLFRNGIQLINGVDKYILDRIAAYEQITLFQETKLSKKQISKLLGIRQDSLSPKNFRAKHGFDLPGEEKYPLEILLYDYPQYPEETLQGPEAE